MRITAADLRQIKARQSALALPKSHVWPTWCLIFVPGKLTNPLNASGWTWRKRSKWTEEWHDKVAGALFEGGYRRGWWLPEAPKRITFTAHVKKRFDSQDNLRASLKPVVDALQKCGVIHGDDDSSGHQFVYPDQIVNNSWAGVELKVELLPMPCLGPECKR